MGTAGKENYSKDSRGQGPRGGVKGLEVRTLESLNAGTLEPHFHTKGV